MIEKILPYIGYDDGQLRIREEQEFAIQRMMEEPTKSVMNGSNMDTGKTLQASEFVVRLDLERVLYVGVKDTFQQWFDRLEAQSDGDIQLRRIDGTLGGLAAFASLLAGDDGHFFAGSQFLTAKDYKYNQVKDGEGRDVMKIDAKHPAGQAAFSVNMDGIIFPTSKLKKRIHTMRYAKMLPVEAIIYDEVHVVGNAKSLGIRTLRTIKTEWKLAMSGTMAGNKFVNLHTISFWLWPLFIHPNAVRWADQWCASETPIGRDGNPVTDARGRPVRVITGEKIPGEFVKTLPCYIRLEGEPNVPKPEIFRVTLSPEQRIDYESLEQDGVAWLEAHPGLKPLVTSLPIEMRTRLRTAALGTMSLAPDGHVYFDEDTISSKLAALRQITERPDWINKPVAIYTHSKTFLKVVVARMRRAGCSVVEWSGDVSSKERDRIKAAFLAGEIQYIVAVISSFGTGLDGFQRVCSNVIWISEDENNKDNQQAVRRFFRTGVVDFKHVKIVAEDTHDENVWLRNDLATASMKASLRIAA